MGRSPLNRFFLGVPKILHKLALEINYQDMSANNYQVISPEWTQGSFLGRVETSRQAIGLGIGIGCQGY